ncbi:hypothetical protein M9Y10_002364 [Tritrichomonas musculus]|uniref:Uncharacterized protein n=1 Tax=Tritrichomonas musculus TaxID=1915356 RepID=A0ABR2L9K1_9EUKA
MSNKRELLYHLKKVQSLTSSIPYKNHNAKRKNRKTNLKKKTKNSNLEDDLYEANIYLSHNTSNKDGDLDFYFALFHREQEFKKYIQKLKLQIYFIRWCHSFELKVLNRKHPKHYYNPKISSFVDQFPSTYQEPSIKLKDTSKISQIPLPVPTSEKIVDAVKRVSKAHRKSILEKETQSQNDKKISKQAEILAARIRQDFYQDTDSINEDNDNYDEDLLKFTSELLSKRAISMKKRTENGTKNNSKYSYETINSFKKKAGSKINIDDTSISNLSTDSSSSKLNTTKKHKSKEQIKNSLKVSPAFELHTKRAKKTSNPKLTSNQISTESSTSSNININPKFNVETVSTADSSSNSNSKDISNNNKKDNFFDFDPFTFETSKSKNKKSTIQSSISSESSQNQQFKLMQIGQSVISIKPDKLKIVNISDQDQSLPPISSNIENKFFQFSNNEYNISVPPSQSPIQSQTQTISASSSSSSTTTTKSQDKDNLIPNNLLLEEDSSSQTEVNTGIDQTDLKIEQSPNLHNQHDSSLDLIQPKTQNKPHINSNTNNINEDDNSSDLDFDLSDLKLPKSIKTNKNNQPSNSKMKLVNVEETKNTNPNQSKPKQSNSLINEDENEYNEFSNTNFNVNNEKATKKYQNNVTNTNLTVSFDDINKNNLNSIKTVNQQNSSITSKPESNISKIPEIIKDEAIFEEEEEEVESEVLFEKSFQTEKKEKGIIKPNSNNQKEDKTNEEIGSFNNDIDDANSQQNNSSKVHFSFNEQENSAKFDDILHETNKEDETEDEIKLKIDLRDNNKKKKKRKDDFNLKDILPLSILDEIMDNNSSNSDFDDNTDRKLNNSNNLFTSDEEKIIQSYLSNSDDDNDDVNQEVYKEQENQLNGSDILEMNNTNIESNSNSSTPPNTKNKSNQKSSPLSLSSGYDDDSSSSESYIDKLKKIFPNLDLD